MRFVSVTLIGLVLLFAPHAGKAQTLDPSTSTADFSGSWVLDRKATTDSSLLRNVDELTLVINQDKNAISVTYRVRMKEKTRVTELRYFTDGRGEDNRSAFGGQARSSKTFWSYGNLVSEYVITTSMSGTFYKQEARDLWEISKDREVLTIRTEIGEVHLANELLRMLLRPQKYKRVYRRSTDQRAPNDGLALVVRMRWCTQQDSNLRPFDSKSNALSN